MSNREKIPEWIDRFNNGELSNEEVKTLLEMAKNDPRLREEIKLDLELNSILTDEDILDLRKKMLTLSKIRLERKGNNLKFYLMAASLLLLLGIGLFLFFYNVNRSSNAKPGENTLSQKNHPPTKQSPAYQQINSSKTSSDTANRGNTISTEQRGTNLLASYDKNPSLENMIGTTRNAGNFAMVFPLNDYHCSVNADVRFEWLPEGPAEVELRIMNNFAILVHESGTIKKNTYSIPPGKLKQGLYYFKILSGDEILYFGKFTIE
jgi:hypothetical protein